MGVNAFTQLNLSIKSNLPPPSDRALTSAWLRAQRWPLLSSSKSGSFLSRNLRSPYRTGRGPSSVAGFFNGGCILVIG